MTLIDKAEALAPCPFCGGEAELWNAHDNRPAWIACMGRCAVLISKEHATDAEAIAAWNRRAISALGVGVPESVIHRTVLDWIRDDAGVAVKMSVTPDQANALTARILAALATTDAAHVNETPKSEHDGADVLTAAQAREAALSGRITEALVAAQERAHRAYEQDAPFDPNEHKVRISVKDAYAILALLSEART